MVVDTPCSRRRQADLCSGARFSLAAAFLLSPLPGPSLGPRLRSRLVLRFPQRRFSSPVSLPGLRAGDPLPSGKPLAAVPVLDLHHRRLDAPAGRRRSVAARSSPWLSAPVVAAAEAPGVGIPRSLLCRLTLDGVYPTAGHGGHPGLPVNPVWERSEPRVSLPKGGSARILGDVVH